MKIVKVILILALISSPLLGVSSTIKLHETFSSPSLSRWTPVSGTWKVINGRLTQTNVRETMAMITIPVDQDGVMLYEFDLKYVRGGEDDYAGFGIHICTNIPTNKRSWGNGRSTLGWITWDPKQYGSPGAFIQVYKSTGITSMGLDTRIFSGSDPLRYGGILPVGKDYLRYEYLNYTVPVKIQINTRTGRGRFYDPFNPDRYYYSFDLGAPIRPGGYLTLRMNSISLSIDNVRVTQLD